MGTSIRAPLRPSGTPPERGDNPAKKYFLIMEALRANKSELPELTLLALCPSL